MRSLFIQKLQENKKIKLEILIKREEKNSKFKTAGLLYKHKYNFEVERMKNLLSETNVTEIIIIDANNKKRVGLSFKAPFNYKKVAKYLCLFERRLLRNTGLNCAFLFNKKTMEKIG
ncbi:hypothetical protein HUW75_04980 [Fusobacterium polymorphum]|jgi:hypothetical protein|uniref:hypothetical protein n=1 Tax=Fusobacterium nucleatum subsp. polymorphum TaxID=76857 RepID=UPI00300A5264